jgi:hypothetical protein
MNTSQTLRPILFGFGSHSAALNSLLRDAQVMSVMGFEVEVRTVDLALTDQLGRVYHYRNLSGLPPTDSTGFRARFNDPLVYDLRRPRPFPLGKRQAAFMKKMEERAAQEWTNAC